MFNTYLSPLTLLWQPTDTLTQLGYPLLLVQREYVMSGNLMFPALLFYVDQNKLIIHTMFDGRDILNKKTHKKYAHKYNPIQYIYEKEFCIL